MKDQVEWMSVLGQEMFGSKEKENRDEAKDVTRRPFGKKCGLLLRENRNRMDCRFLDWSLTS